MIDDKAGKLAMVEGNQFDGFDVVSGTCGGKVVLQANWVFRDGADEYAEKLNTAADAFALKKVLRALEMVSDEAESRQHSVINPSYLDPYMKTTDDQKWGMIVANMKMLEYVRSLASKIEKGEVVL